MRRLRAPDGCPWDRAQTPATLKTYLVEEAYEVLEAIDESDPDKLKEELGDLLLQVIFLSEIAEEEGRFDVADVCAAVTGKLYRRHPHVFGDAKAADATEAYGRWQALKRKEGKGTLAGVPPNLP
ncbi:MAG: MazG family protein, partial [Deltaproteobacteria bacterium]|nr:MazG family protein [Deltaproteobacteria bacterium]